MGGIGSGRRYVANEVKPCVENQPAINILDLKNQGFLKPGVISFFSVNSSWVITTASAEYLRLDYFCNGIFRQQTIQMTSTSPNYGGRRKYLVCPQCHSKREMLYHGKTGKFACRSCHNFVYRSSQLNEHQRHAFLAEKIKRDKLGQINYPYKKPFRMWNKTYLKLKDKAITHEIKSCEIFAEYFDGVIKKYGLLIDEEKGRAFLDGDGS